jgi:hypothetical protein
MCVWQKNPDSGRDHRICWFRRAAGAPRRPQALTRLLEFAELKVGTLVPDQFLMQGILESCGIMMAGRPRHRLPPRPPGPVAAPARPGGDRRAAGPLAIRNLSWIRPGPPIGPPVDPFCRVDHRFGTRHPGRRADTRSSWIRRRLGRPGGM